MDQNKIAENAVTAKCQGDLELLKMHVDERKKDQDKIIKDAVTELYEGNLDILEISIDEDLDVVSIGRGKTLLHIAVQSNRTIIVKLWLGRGADVNFKNPINGKSICGKNEIVRILLDAGADIHTTTRILHLIVEKGYRGLIKIMLNKDADVNAKDTYGQSPLSEAARCKNEEIKNILLDAGADITHVLHDAVKNGYSKLTKLLLNGGADVNARNIYDETPLKNSAIFFNTDVMKILLDAGADIDTSYILHEVVEKGWEEHIKLLLNKGANVNIQNRNGRTPLQQAALYRERSEIVKLLLDAGAAVDTSLFNLHDVVEEGHKQLTKLLLERGAKVNAKNNYGKTPLHIAAEYDIDEEMVKMLIDAGANVNARDKRRESVLYKAFWYDSNFATAVIQLLISKGAKINIKTKFGNTPLYEAALNGEEELVRVLLKKGAPVNAALKDDGKTPLFVAQNCKIAEILLKNGADINAKTKAGRTALHHAISKKATCEMVDVLLKNNADIHARSNDGTSILAEAVRCQNSEVAKALLNHEIDINTRDKDGMTPLMHAVLNGDNELVEVLLDKRADVSAKTDNNHSALSFALLNALNQFDLDKVADTKQNNISFAAFYTEKKALIKILLDHGADINDIFVLDSLFMTAIELCRKDMVNFLLANGANININATYALYDRAAIHEAAACGVHELVENLLSRGAKINARNSVGETALHTVVENPVYDHGHKYISNGIDPLLVRTFYYDTPNTESYRIFNLGVLLNNGADLEAENKSCETPLFYAVHRHVEYKVNFLLNNGANINHSGLGSIFLEGRIYIDGLSYIVSASMVKLLQKHVIKRKCARLFINKIYEDQFPFGLFEYQTECSKEITNIKNELICNHISLYDLLIKPTKQLVGYLKDENLVRSIKLDKYEAKFPEYYEMIKYRIQNGLRQKELLEYGERFLNGYVFGSLQKLPYICCNRIISYLSKEDLVSCETVVKGR